jgi:hypothetical protein
MKVDEARKTHELACAELIKEENNEKDPSTYNKAKDRVLRAQQILDMIIEEKKAAKNQ